MDNLHTNIGNRMKISRKALGFTQEEMAEKLGISVKHYGGVERGIAGLSIENYIELSKILGISLDYLIKGSSQPDNYVPDRLTELYLKFPPEKRPNILTILELML